MINRSWIALAALLAAAPALAASTPVQPTKPSSFAPRPANSSHVYGSPIAAPLVGRANAVRPEAARPAAARHKVTSGSKAAPRHSKARVSKAASDRPTPNT